MMAHLLLVDAHLVGHILVVHGHSIIVVLLPLLLIALIQGNEVISAWMHIAAFEYLLQNYLRLICFKQVRLKADQINFHVIDFVYQGQASIEVE